jgi:hypothetical protein
MEIGKKSTDATDIIRKIHWLWISEISISSRNNKLYFENCILGALVVSFIVRDLYPLPKLIQFAEDISGSVGNLAADYPDVLDMKVY